jgi:HSP20 family molecular chaperone IbpA
MEKRKIIYECNAKNLPMIHSTSQSICTDPVINSTVFNRKDQLHTPAIVLEETGKKYTLYINIGTQQKRNIEITVRKNMLYIISNDDTRYIDKIICTNNHYQYDFHQLNISFALPVEADASAAYAEIKNGMISVYFPKNNKASKFPFLKLPIRNAD